jgi:exodeoxyribonuclease V alpha subunit
MTATDTTVFAAVGLLHEFNQAGVLLPADVHTARCLARLGGDPDELVSLAAALAVRAPRVGHVSVDLTNVREVAGADTDDDVTLSWPEPSLWLERVAASPLVAVGETSADRPLRLIGSSLYLDRYWRDEVAVASDLRLRAASPPPPVDAAELSASLARLFSGPSDDDQRTAVEAAAGRWFSVIAGGPGTGKTTTVARLLAVLFDQAAATGSRPPLVGLAAPTGKAAARLEEAVRAAAPDLQLDPAGARQLQQISGSTLHRLLGARPGSVRFRHHRGLRLPHDVIVVDEASMVSLALMARLLEAVRPDARLVLVGDPEQLVSVEAGAVLADVVGPAAAGTVEASPMTGTVSLLRTNHRFAGTLADLAVAVRTGDEDATLDVLAHGEPAVSWVPSAGALRPAILDWAGRLVDAARRGDGPAALQELARHRVLCLHREGPDGVEAWNEQIEHWLGEDVPELAGEGEWYAGRPVLVTHNDYALRLYNGDTGVTVADRPRVTVMFDDGGRTRPVSPSRLADVETVFAMTVHKSQGSEFDRVTLLLPATSRLLTRELLYTAVTRARHGLVVVGSEEAVRLAVGRPIARASGLTERLWTG